MGTREILKVGMRPVEVCQALPGWQLNKIKTADSPSNFYTYDFVSPDQAEVIRVTFDETGVVAWGEPSRAPT